MKKFTFFSLLAILALGVFTSCQQPSYDNQFFISYRSEYGDAPLLKYVDPGYKLTEEDLPTLEDQYHTFTGWMYSATSEKAVVGQEINDNTTLEALWDLKIFKITFVNEHGTAPDPIEVAYGENKTLDNLLDLTELYPSCKGYNFKGWSYEKNGEIISPFEQLYLVEDVTLYAVWEEIKSSLTTDWTYDYNSNTNKYDLTNKIPDKSIITKITLQLEKYTGNYSDSWEFEESKNPYTVYKNGTEIIISANATDPKEKFVFEDNCHSMFDNFSSVTEIVFPKEIDTSNITDMWRMFYGCSKLESLDLSGFNTSKVTDMNSMFSSCQSLTSLNISNFDTSNVTTMKSMFAGCEKLESLDVSKFNTSKVTDMNSMFSSCLQLESLDVSKLDTSNVTDMSGMFSSCKNLKSLDVSKFNTSKVTDMSNMFYFCQSLTSLNISIFDTSNVTKMDGMFSFCKNLKSLDVSKFNTSKVTDMNSMFYFCQSLTSLNISNFDTSNVTKMDRMFSVCSQLEFLDVSKFNTSKVTDMSGMFSSCSQLKCIFASDKFTTAKITSPNDGADMFTGDNNLIGYDTNPASGANQYSFTIHSYNNNYNFAQIYKATDITQGIYGQEGFFTDIANKEAVLAHLSSL